MWFLLIWPASVGVFLLILAVERWERKVELDKALRRIGFTR